MRRDGGSYRGDVITIERTADLECRLSIGREIGSGVDCCEITACTSFKNECVLLRLGTADRDQEHQHKHRQESSE